MSTATVRLTADLSGTAVATLVVRVTAADIATPLIFNIPIASGAASGLVTLPAGSDRTITMQAYDAGGVRTHSGSVTVGIQAGTNPTISIVLVPLTGDLPINATLGSVTVAVLPTAVTLEAGQTAALSAAIQDVNGTAVVGTVLWATRDPGVAVVDSTGLVTARGTGTSTVSATFLGATGGAVVTVAP